MLSIESLRAELVAAEGVLLFEDLGAPAGVLAEVRRMFRDAGLAARSLRTQQLRRALVGTPYEVLQGACSGALLVVVVARGPARAAAVAGAVERLCERVRVRACAVPGAQIGLDAMTRVASLGEARAGLLAALRWAPHSLLEGLMARVLDAAGEVSLPDLRCERLAEVSGLRRRLAPLLAGPDVGSVDGPAYWCDGPLDAAALFAEVSGLRLRPDWRLGAYAYRSGGNGNGVVWALPPGSPAPRKIGRSEASLFAPPWPAGGRSFAEAIEGDGSLLSYLHASILIREVGEYGALWHGVGWGDSVLVDRVPPDEPWTFHERPPRRLVPRVIRRGGDVVVEFWSVCRRGQVRLYRHVDRYVGGGYRMHAEQTLVATGGHGYVH